MPDLGGKSGALFHVVFDVLPHIVTCVSEGVAGFFDVTFHVDAFVGFFAVYKAFHNVNSCGAADGEPNEFTGVQGGRADVLQNTKSKGVGVGADHVDNTGGDSFKFCDAFCFYPIKHLINVVVGEALVCNKS